MSDSPYRPPTREAISVAEHAPHLDTPALLPFAQLGLRLLGVMLVVDGIGALFGGLVQGLLQAWAYSDAGYAVPIDPHSAGWAAGGTPHLIAGLYFVVGGNWILEKVFMSSRHQVLTAREDADDSAAPEPD